MKMNIPISPEPSEQSDFNYWEHVRITKENYPKLFKMMEFAEQRHQGQLYGNEPYTVHLKDVLVTALKAGFRNDDILTAMFGHDLIEDTDVTYEVLVAEFNEEIANMILAVTHKEEETYEIYMNRICSDTLEIRAIKLADLISNHKASIQSKEVERVFKYEKALSLLRYSLHSEQIPVSENPTNTLAHINSHLCSLGRAKDSRREGK